jgi:hypothetical protein
MKSREDVIQELMLKSFEGSLSISEQTILDEAIGSSKSMYKKFEELKELRHLMSAYELDDNQLWDDEDIMRFIPGKKAGNQPKVFTLGRYWSRIAAACVFACIISMSSVYFQNGSIDADTLVGVDDIYADEAYTYLSTNYAYNE